MKVSAAEDPLENGKTILYLVIIAIALVVVITVVICALERSRKRTEQATLTDISIKSKAADDELSVPMNPDGKQDINASIDPNNSLK